LTVMTTAPAGQTGGGNMDLGRSTANIERIMGLFYAGCDPTDSACGQTKGILTSKQQTNLVGTALGYVLCFAIVGGGNPACPNGGQVPSFFQVIPDSNNLVASIGTPGGGTFTVVSVQRYWVECKRTPGDTLPLTGFCSYQS